MLRATTSDTATISAKAITCLPQEQMKFALNVAEDTLAHNSNLHLWRKKESEPALWKATILDPRP